MGRFQVGSLRRSARPPGTPRFPCSPLSPAVGSTLPSLSTQKQPRTKRLSQGTFNTGELGSIRRGLRRTVTRSSIPASESRGRSTGEDRQHPCGLRLPTPSCHQHCPQTLVSWALRATAPLASGRPGRPLGWLARGESTQEGACHKQSGGRALGEGATPTLLISRCRSLVTISSKTSPSPLMSLGEEGGRLSL